MSDLLPTPEIDHKQMMLEEFRKMISHGGLVLLETTKARCKLFNSLFSPCMQRIIHSSNKSTFKKFDCKPTIEGAHIDATGWVLALPFGRHLPPAAKMFDSSS
jgi:hypothetical protein